MHPPVFPDHDPPILFYIFWIERIGRELVQSEVPGAIVRFCCDNALRVVLFVWYILHFMYPPRQR